MAIDWDSLPKELKMTSHDKAAWEDLQRKTDERLALAGIGSGKDATALKIAKIEAAVKTLDILRKFELNDASKALCKAASEFLQAQFTMSGFTIQPDPCNDPVEEAVTRYTDVRTSNLYKAQDELLDPRNK